jgi:predicted aspartyl protease
MMEGYFGEGGGLYFEIELIAADGSAVTVDALLDTGFTDWLAIDSQDLDGFGWLFVRQQRRQTARGKATFDLYAGTVVMEGEEFAIPILAGKGLGEVIIGMQWLEDRRLVVDKKAGVLTLEKIEE